MFRCDNCGSGYSARAATWESCPRCYAKEGANYPLAFEVGWRRPNSADGQQPAPVNPAVQEALADGASRPSAMS